MRRLLRIALFLLVLLLIAGYVLYSYWPRERSGAPEPGGLPASLLASGEYGACLWVPYPHQNLGRLAGSIEDGPEYVAAAARVAELPVPELPSFGPFAVPPSREIVACSDLDGGRFLLVARVYPGLAAIAKLAGRLADNPWLKGGEVRETRRRRSEVEERVLQVAWRDGFWTVLSGDAPEALTTAAPAAAAPLPESLASFHLGADVSDLPAGDYVLQRRGQDLEVTLVGGAAAPTPPVVVGGDAPVLLAVAGPSWPAESPRPVPPAALALFEGEGDLNLGPLGKMPGAAVLNPPEGHRWGLPGRGIAGLIAKNLPRGNAAGWEIVGLDAASVARAETLAPEISSLVPPTAAAGAAADGPGARLVLGLWVQPPAALRLVTKFRKGLERVPLMDRRQVATWRDWETLLRPLAACQRASLAATRSPSAFLLRLQSCG